MMLRANLGGLVGDVARNVAWGFICMSVVFVVHNL